MALQQEAPKRTVAELTQIIADSIAAVTGMRANDVDIEKPFMNMGIESLQAVSIIADLNKRLGVQLAATTMFDYPTVRALAESLGPADLDSKNSARVDRGGSFNEPIAVVGMACRFPGASSPDEFWKRLREGFDAISPLPESRPFLRDMTHGQIPPWGGFLENIETFDADAFGISSHEATRMDPQQRLLLETAWETIESAGRAPSELRKSRTGVFVGISSSDYSLLGAQSGLARDIFDATGNAHSIASNRISYVFDLRGPSVSVDTACSSSLVSIHQACESLRSGESDNALAGGVNLILTSSLAIAFTQAQMLSPNGRCQTFSDTANGYVRGEGVGLVFLRRLSDAKKDGDHILAVIRGSAVNQDGKSSGLTAPNGPAQEAVIHDALSRANLTPKDISYIEAHGTGTPLGDPIEYLALARVIGEREIGQECWVGSVKTNIGHLESCAGVAGVIKTIQALRAQWLPQNLHFQKLNPKIADGAKYLRVVTQGRKWEIPKDGPQLRRAGVSSFGFGGTNAHLILEEYVAEASPETDDSKSDAQADYSGWPSHLLVLSATQEEPLKRLAHNFSESLGTLSDADSKNLSLASSKLRSDLPLKLVVHGANRDAVREQIRNFSIGIKSQGWVTGRTVRRQTPKLAFLYTGQGSQSPGMGAGLYKDFSSYRQAFDACCSGFNRFFEHDLHEIIQGESESSATLLAQTDYGQAAIFSLGYSLTKLLKEEFSITPQIVFGHSLGEFTAACVAGAMDLNSAIRLVAARGQLMQSTPEGGMAVLFASSERVRSEILSRVQGRIAIAAVNGPSNIVVSGESGAISQVEQLSKEFNIRCVRLRVSRAFHSPLMDSVLPTFEQAAAKIKFQTPTLPLVSGLKGAVLDAHGYSASYWREHLRAPTLFNQAMRAMDAERVTGYLEIGPHPTLLPMAQSCLPDSKSSWFATQSRQSSSTESLFQALAEMTIGGFWSPGDKVPKSRVSDLTKTLFHRERHWAFDQEPVVAPPAPILQESANIATEAVQMSSQVSAQNNEINENRILGELQEIVSRLLQVSANDFNVDEPLIDMGADSLLLLNAVQTIKDKYGVSIPISDIFQEVSTLRKMATYIVVHAPAPAQSARAPETQRSTSPSSMTSLENTMSLNMMPSAMAAQSAAQQNNMLPPFSMTSAAIPGDGFQSQFVHSSSLQNVIQQQLQLMSLQLRMLHGGGAVENGAQAFEHSATTPHQSAHQSAHQSSPAQATMQQKVSSTVSSPTPAPTGEKRGVLGNFKTFADREVMQLADDRKAKFLAEMITKFNARTAKTKQHTQAYRRTLADNRVSAGFRPNTKEIVYTIICHKAKGSRFVDFDGNEYLDFTMGFGVNLFGHSPDFIETAVKKQISLGMAVGPQSDLAGPVAQHVADLTGQERVAFCNSGTEAVMTAIRLARGATKREKIVIFDGSYHGHFDGVLARPDSSSGESRPVAAGVTKGFVGDVMVLEYGAPESLEIIRKHAHELAAVLVEPVQSRFPELQPVEFLKEIRRITENSGTALVVDEVITGFRIHPGGAQAHFGIKADIASYGKILGGGLPIGAVGGKARFMDLIDGGHWDFGDDSFPRAEMTFFAGTFSKHPLAMAAAEAVLLRMKSEGTKLIGDLNRRTLALQQELNAFFTSRGLDLHVNSFGSLFRFKANANLDLFFYSLNMRGFYIWEGRNLFLSTAHTDDDVKQFVAAVKEVTDEMIDYEFFKKKDLKSPNDQSVAASVATSAATSAPSVAGSASQGSERFPFLPSQLRFKELSANGAEAACHICLSVKMKGELVPQRLEQALRTVISHYDAFRARADLKSGHQWVISAQQDLKLEHKSVAGSSLPWPDLDKMLREFGAKPFDLSQEMGARFMLIDVVPETSVFAMVCHHVFFDGWSVAQFIEDVASVYSAIENGQTHELKKTMNFFDFLAHPNKFGTVAKTTAAREFWEKKFANYRPTYVPWPGTPKDTKSLDGQRVIFDIEYGLYKKIKKTAQSLKLTPLMFMLAAYAQVVREIGGAQEFIIGTPAANRDLDGADKMVGNCANLLPIRLEMRDDLPSLEFLTKLKADMLQSYQNMVHPYEDIEAKVGAPLFNLSFNVEPASELPDFGDVTLFIHPFPITASEFDLTVNLTDLEYFYHGEADFRTTLLEDGQVVKWMDRFVAILKQMVDRYGLPASK